MAAALFDSWTPQNLTTVTILTRDPFDEGLECIHDRQPLFLSEQEAATWLRGMDPGVIIKGLQVEREDLQ